MKYLLNIFALLLVSNIGFAQLKVYPTGHVGIGSVTPNPSFSLALDNGGSKGLIHYRYGEAFRAGATGGGAVIGSSDNIIYFWYSGQYNDLHANHLYTLSDSTAKHNILKLESGLDVIGRIIPYKYNFKKDSSNKDEFGFLAQQIDDIIPSAVTKTKGDYLVDYQMVIPFLVRGMQEQQNMLSKQDSIINLLQSQINLLIENSDPIETKTAVSDNNNRNDAVLHQNKPNPFKEQTTINFEITNSYQKASLMIFDMKGTLLKTFPITDKNVRQVIIGGKQFKAGMYMYSLIIDDKIVDTKKMILQK